MAWANSREMGGHRSSGTALKKKKAFRRKNRRDVPFKKPWQSPFSLSLSRIPTKAFVSSLLIRLPGKKAIASPLPSTVLLSREFSCPLAGKTEDPRLIVLGPLAIS
ncbi:hypothetical protein BaRGS_00004274 [Batillaria attramentaria]|uniref:Uncharacterized protein n=1 Tax=Batillaria attramentaria TaxID=370345 RepID=A0ABD0LZG9_9CAEN